VAEASAATIVLRIGGRWLTPPVEDGALPGIARALLLETGAARVETIEEARLEAAEAICLVNSLGLRRAATLENRTLDQAEPDA
jgi:branched-chain amino acid aminotransferase